MKTKMDILLNQAKSVTPSPYQVKVLDIFAEHHNCLGMDQDEIQDMIAETPFASIEKWLQVIGYDLDE